MQLFSAKAIKQWICDAVQGDLGPLHMSPVDWAYSVNRMNFVFCSYGKFQPGHRTEIKFEKQNKLAQEQCKVHDYHSFVDSCTFSNKDNSHTSEVEIHTRQKYRYAILATMLRKCSYFVKNVFPRLPEWSVNMGKFLARLLRSRLEKPRSRQVSQPSLSYDHTKFL